jgi:hypothetical protein
MLACEQTLLSTKRLYISALVTSVHRLGHMLVFSGFLTWLKMDLRLCTL